MENIIYFKIISSNEIVGVATSRDCRCFQKKNGLYLFCDIEQAQYIMYGNIYYHDAWLRAVDGGSYGYQWATISVIDETEYNALVKAFETQSAIEIVPEEPEMPFEMEEEPEPDVSLEFVRKMKVTEMSAICHRVIENGVDVTLSDGNTYHFSMELEDQLKVQALALKAERGEDELLAWHPDDQLCVFYTAKDILTIFHALETLQTVQTTYFNSLKNYIKSIDNMEELYNVEYGMDIPEQYQSDVWKYILLTQNSGGSQNYEDQS